MKVRVWLKGHRDEASVFDMKGLITEPIFPMNVRDYLCRSGFFSWSDYKRIRYEMIKNGKNEKK